MTNELIQLDSAGSVIEELDALLQSRNKVLMLILGDTPERRQLATDVVAHTEAGPGLQSLRYAVLVTVPDAVYPRILGLPTNNIHLPAVFTGAGMYGITLATDGTVCSVLAGTTDADIALGFLLAETH
jgi:hypothetical protein